MQTVGPYQIDIFREETFAIESVDHLHKYDIEHFDESEYIFATIVGIKVFKDESLLTSAIIGSIGGGTGINKSSDIYEDTRVLICFSDSIFCLSIPNLTLLWMMQADQATCFEIFKYQEDYIVHGELEISRLNKDGKMLWQLSGADISTTIAGGQYCELTENFIIAKDFENRVYKFDYDGKDLAYKTQFSWLS